MADPLGWMRDRLVRALKLDARRQAKENDEFLEAAADMGADRLDDYQRSGRYYTGDHRVPLTSREREYLQISGLPYAENFCETIVNTLVNRLKVRGFGSKEEELATFAKGFWRDNRLAAGHKQVHEDAVKFGDGFVILEPGDDGKPRAHRNPPHMVKVVYDSGEPLYGVKKWKTRRVSRQNPRGETITRLNIYWPDSVEKWFSLSEDGDWAPFVEEFGADASHVRVWTMDGTPAGDPIGIPALHFAHRPDATHYGRSKLRSVIPQQDALNKSLLDFFWVMDAQGWPQQWAKGVSNQTFERSPGFVWTTESDVAEFGQLDAADPAKLILGIESQIKRMAARSNTPLHLMLAGGDMPSGESLKTSESGLAAEAEDIQEPFGDKYVDMVLLAARIERAFGPSDPPVEDVTLDCHWERAESRSEIDEANTAVLYQSLGVSQDSILSYLGFDPAEEREKRERDGDAAQQLLERAQQMQAPTRSEEAGGGQQPAQRPENRRV